MKRGGSFQGSEAGSGSDMGLVSKTTVMVQVNPVGHDYISSRTADCVASAWLNGQGRRNSHSNELLQWTTAIYVIQ